MSDWRDGDDSALYDEGYVGGVRDAVRYMRDELGLDVTDSDGLLDMAGGRWSGDV